MHPDDQHLLVVGAVEDPDPPAFGKPARRAPEKVVLQLLGGRLLEAEDLAALRIDPRHDVADGAILAGRVHPLQDQQQGIAVGRVVQALQGVQCLDVCAQELLILLLRPIDRLHARRPFLEVDLVSGPYPEVL